MKFRYILVVVVPFHLFGKPLIMEMKAKFPWRFDGFWEFLPLHIHQSRWQWRFGILSLSKYVYCNDQSKSTNKQKLDKILDLLFFSTPSSCTVNDRNVICQHLKPQTINLVTKIKIIIFLDVTRNVGPSISTIWIKILIVANL